MSTETEDERIERLERALRQHSAIHRRRMRWWKHAREYLSLRRLVVNRLVAEDFKEFVAKEALSAWREHIRAAAAFGGPPSPSGGELGAEHYKESSSQPAIHDHPPWSSNWWQAERPIRFVKGGGR